MKQRLFPIIIFLLWLTALPSAGQLPGDTLNADLLQSGHTTNALDALSGKAAGVSITGSGNSEAMLSSVRVRGNTSLTGGNEPLVIIDGMSSDLKTLASIYPADIESFNILKDASQTAQYGSRGAAGVIEVQTKRGVTGRFHIGYSGDIGFQHADHFLPMLSGQEYRSLTAARGLSIVDGGSDTDWQREVVQTAFVQNHHIAFGGGTEDTRYRASLSYSNNNSVIRTLGNHNFTAKLDVTQRAAGGRLSLDLGLFGSTQQRRYLNDRQRFFYSAAAFNPTFPAGRNASGGWDGYADASQINHPMALLDNRLQNDGVHFNTHLRVSGDLGYGLTLSAYGSYSYASEEEQKFFPTYTDNYIHRGQQKTETWLVNADLAYRLERGIHKVEAKVTGELQGITTSGFHTRVDRLATNAFGYYNLSAGALRLWDGTGSMYEEQRLLSVMGHASYTLLGRYTLTLTARGDASSLAGANHKWGFFPSASLAWDMHRERWLAGATWLNRLRLHAGYGLSGNLSGIGSYHSLQLVAPTGITEENGMPVVTLGIMRNANPDLRWENKRTVDVGLDASVLDGRISLTAGWYYSHISDMLYDYTVSVPPFIYNRLLANLGQMMNSGVEAGMGIMAVRTRDFDFNIGINLTWQQNKLISLNGWFDGEYLTAPQYTPIASLNGAGLHGGFNNVVYQIPGQPLGVFYLPHCTGLEIQADGTRTYILEDMDGTDGIDLSNGGDRRVCGQATPKILLGSNFSFRYKQLDLTIQFNGAFGHKIYNGSALSYMNTGALPYYNISKKAAKLNINDMTVSDYWLERGDYLNIDYATLGWNLPLEQWSRRTEARQLPQLRVAFSVNNLATITGYSGLTPIINSSVIDSTLGIDDKRSFPVSRTYSLAISLQF